MSSSLVPFVFGREALWDPWDSSSHLFDPHFGSDLINEAMALSPSNHYLRRHPLGLVHFEKFYIL